MEKVKYQLLSSEEFKNVIAKAGSSLVGFGDVSPGLAGELRHLSCAISIAVRHFPVEIIKAGGVNAYSHQVAAVDKKLEQIQKTAVSTLKSCGYRSLAIPPDSMRRDKRFVAKLFPLFPHKTAATCAGLGWIGKSGLLVNEQFGPRLSWATVLTNAPLQASAAPYYTGRCGSCKICIKICPAGAIEDREWVRGETGPSVDYSLCGEYIEKNRKILGKAVCGLCIMSCPKGRGDVKETD